MISEWLSNDFSRRTFGEVLVHTSLAETLGGPFSDGFEQLQL